MQQIMTSQPKLTKKYLLTVMRTQLEGRIFDRVQYQQQYGLADRKVRRYINEIAEEYGSAQADNLAILKNYCTDNLITKAIAGELDESTEAKIALSGDTSKIDVNLNQNISIKKQIEALVKFSRGFDADSPTP
jgi:hypothetical protein